MAAKTKNKTFEQSMERLDEIVSLLECGNTDLEGSIKLFTEGVALIGECTKTLDEAELKVKKMFAGDGDAETEKSDD